MARTMIVDCPSCETTFPVDPNKVPDGGVHARCSVCSDVFFVDVAEPEIEPAGVLAADLETPPGEEWAAVDEDAFDAVEAGVEESFEVADDLIPDADAAVATEAEPDWYPEGPEEEEVWETPTPPEPEAEVAVDEEKESSWIAEEEPAPEEEPPVAVEEEPAWTAAEEPSWTPEDDSGQEVEAVTEVQEEPATLEEEPVWAPEPPVEAEVEFEEEEPVFEAGLPVDFVSEEAGPVEVDVGADLPEEAFEVEPFYPPGADLELPEIETTPLEEPIGTGEIEPQDDVGDWVADGEDAFAAGEAPFLTGPETEIEPEPEVAEPEPGFEPEGFAEGETPFLAEIPEDSWPASAEEPVSGADELVTDTIETADDLVPDAVETVVEEPFGAADDLVPDAVETVVEEPFGAADDFVPDAVETVVEEPVAAADDLVPETFDTVAEPPAVDEVIEEPAEPVDEAVPTLPTPAFGRRDPEEKAQRLARVLVSDIILYNPDRHQKASETGRIKEEFEDEIQKSWAEYVEQVGEDVATNTSHFTEALNEILARGEQVF